MNKKISTLAVLFFLGVAVVYLISVDNSSKSPARPQVAVGLYAPTFEVEEVGGSARLSSDSLKGRVVFVNFWASWCQPCKEEMPSIEALYNELRTFDDFKLITILYKDTPENALPFMQANGFSLPVFTDPGGTASQRFGVTGVPETYIIDKSGILKKRVIGPTEWDSPEAKELLYSLLK